MAAQEEHESQSALWKRAGLSALLVLLALLGRKVPLPGVDLEAVHEVGGTLAMSRLSVFALGLAPLLSAYVLVEVVALLVPSWRRLRHSGGAGRAKLTRWARILTLILALFQSFGLARYLSALESSSSLPLLVASLSAGFALLFWIAERITRFGVVNGVVALVVVFQLADALGSAEPQRMGPPLWLAAAGVAVAIAASFVCLRWSVAGAIDPGVRGAATAYRAAPESPQRAFELPLPASGAIPLVQLAMLSTLPATLANFGVELPALMSGGSLLLELTVLLALGALWSWLFNQPRRLAAYWAQLQPDSPSVSSTEPARRLLWAALFPTLLFLVVLYLAQAAAQAHPSLWALVAAAPLGVAVVLDALQGLRVARLVPVSAERRACALPVQLQLLREAGIHAQAHGTHTLSILRFFGPYAPAEIRVPAADAARARELLDKFLDGKTQEAVAGGSPTPSGTPRSRSRLQLALLLGLSLALLAGFSMSRRVAKPGQRPVELQVVLIDDSADPFAAVESELPAGISLELENVSLGPNDIVPRRYALASLAPDEAPSAAVARLRTWSSNFKLRPGQRFAFGRAETYMPERDSYEMTGYRSYVVHGDPVLRSGDIADAAVLPSDFGGVVVAVSLHPEGAQRFEAATAANIKRRIAIIADGEVKSAPLVQSRIGGGHVQITSVGTPEEAQRLVDGLLAAASAAH